MQLVCIKAKGVNVSTHQGLFQKEGDIVCGGRFGNDAPLEGEELIYLNAG